MATKGFLTKALNAASLWVQTEFPSAATKQKLSEQGWKTQMYYPDAAASSMGGCFPVALRYTPEGTMVTPGTPEHQRYKDAVKAIVKNQPQP